MPIASTVKKRRYKHFDVPVCDQFAAKAVNPEFVAAHSFSPLIHYVQRTKRYKQDCNSGIRKISIKNRPIMYASHRDAHILSHYAEQLTGRLDEYYEENGLSENVIAYRALGKANYDFAYEVFKFAKENSPVEILAFDIKGFFDNLDHELLKRRLKGLLTTSELSKDWYSVFRFVTKYRYVNYEDLSTHSVFGNRISNKKPVPIATVKELKDNNIKFHKNKIGNIGIPQGTPISAVFSNLYMIEFDVAVKIWCEKNAALYRRYSDDILIVCRSEHVESGERFIEELVKSERLQLSPEKTERTYFDISRTTSSNNRSAQYLGFEFSEDGMRIRNSSLSRQWRRLKKAFNRTIAVGTNEIEVGSADKIWTKKLRKRFSPHNGRNFSSYLRRCDKAFGNDSKIMRQRRRLEQSAEKEFSKIIKLENNLRN